MSVPANAIDNPAGIRATGQGPLLSVSHIGKHFGGIVALNDVSLAVHAGEIAGIVGDNGAGKSTLIKIISAVFPADEGTITFDGNVVAFGSPRAARAAGIETVYQDLALAGNMSVWANVFLGRERCLGPRFLRILNKRGMSTAAYDMLSRFRMNVPPSDAEVASLSGGQRQAIAIARAAAWGSKLIVLDEPTAALGVGETRAVEEVVLELRSRGFGLILISHNIQQVFRLADHIWVMRRGHMIADLARRETTPEEVVGLITGAIAPTERESPA